MDKRTIGTKKTLVFHEGRPPSGRRTEWIMHEYYIDENECQACPDMKGAFVLCKVTKRIDWASESGNEVNNPHPEQPTVAATSVVSLEQPDAAAASVLSPELTNNDATLAATAHTTTLDGDDELQGWLEELIDPSFAHVVDPVSADLFLDEQNAESSNLGDVFPKVEPDYASPNQIVADDTDYLLTDDIYNILCPGTDDFLSWHNTDEAPLAFADGTYSFMEVDPFTLPNNFMDGTQKEEMQFSQENNEPNLSNEAADTGIIVRTRNRRTPATDISSSSRRVKLQVGINRMVTSNSESINQTIKFVDNSGRLDLMTNVEHNKKHAHDVTSVKQSDAGKSSRNHNNQGFFRGFRKAFRGCSAAGLNILVAVFIVGVAVAVLLHGRHRAVVSL
jgi:hypothetical protein